MVTLAELEKELENRRRQMAEAMRNHEVDLSWVMRNHSNGVDWVEFVKGMKGEIEDLKQAIQAIDLKQAIVRLKNGLKACPECYGPLTPHGCRSFSCRSRELRTMTPEIILSRDESTDTSERFLDLSPPKKS
ncbi:MAG: hypothetical protein Q8K86_08800 [Candidatus Nanopelagicaceae bacterium]|nr:hypothetical protein [Candidatus Nanopelagicaceae bacterium]